MDAFARRNKDACISPNYKPHALSTSLKLQVDNAEVLDHDLHMYSNVLLNKFLQMVIGSMNREDIIISNKLEEIITSRRGEDPKLDHSRKKVAETSTILGRKLRMVNNIMEVMVIGENNVPSWFKIEELKMFLSRNLKRIQESLVKDVKGQDEVDVKIFLFVKFCFVFTFKTITRYFRILVFNVSVLSFC